MTVQLTAAQKAIVLAQASYSQAKIISSQRIGSGQEIEVRVTGAHIGKEQIIKLQPSGEAVRTGGFVSDAEARMATDEAKKLPSQQAPLSHVQRGIVKGQAQRAAARPQFETEASATFRSQVAPHDIVPEEVVTKRSKDTGQEVTFTRSPRQFRDIPFDIGDAFQSTGTTTPTQAGLVAAKTIFDVTESQAGAKLSKAAAPVIPIVSKQFAQLTRVPFPVNPFRATPQKNIQFQTEGALQLATEKPLTTALLAPSATVLATALPAIAGTSTAAGLTVKGAGLVAGGVFVGTTGARVLTAPSFEQGQRELGKAKLQFSLFTAGALFAPKPAPIKTKVRQPRPQIVKAKATQKLQLDKVKGRDIVSGKAEIKVKAQTFQRLPKKEWVQVGKVGKAPIYKETKFKPLGKPKEITLKGKVEGFGTREAFKGKTFKQFTNKDIANFIGKYQGKDLKLVKGSFRQVKVRGKGFTKGTLKVYGATTPRENIAVVPKTKTTSRGITKFSIEKTETLDQPLLKFQGKTKVGGVTLTYGKPPQQNLLFQKPPGKVSFTTAKELITFDKALFQQSITYSKAQPPGSIPRTTFVKTETQSITKLPLSKDSLTLKAVGKTPPGFGVKPTPSITNLGTKTIQIQAQQTAQASTTAKAIPSVTQAVVKSVLKTPTTQFKTVQVTKTGQEVVLLSKTQQKQQAFAFAIQPTQKQKQKQYLKPAVITAQKQKTFANQVQKIGVATQLKTLQLQKAGTTQGLKPAFATAQIQTPATIVKQPQKTTTIPTVPTTTMPRIVLVPITPSKPTTTTKPPRFPVGFNFNLKAGKGLSFSKGFKLPKRTFKYTPSVFAIGERIFGKQPKILTGSGIRPLALKFKPITKKKKKKRRKR